MAPLVTSARLSIWFRRTAVVHGSAFARQESTIRSSLNESLLTAVATGERTAEIEAFRYIVG